MDNTYLLFGLIILILLIDFIIKKIKDRKQNKKTRWISFARRSVKITMVISLISVLSLTFAVEYADLDFGEIEIFFIVFFILFWLSVLLLIILYFKRIINYIKKRKRNISLFLLSIVPLKLIIHFIFFTELSSTTRRLNLNRGNIYARKYLDFTDHLELVFDEKLWIFPLVIFSILYFSWYFKIKAR